MATDDDALPDPPLATEQDGEEAFDLGEPAKDVYTALAAGSRREQMLELARQMSELTVPSCMPPKGYKAGDNLPGNNQSVGAQCVSNLASKLMFTAFPPGQPCMRLDPVEQKLQKEIDQDPQLWAVIQLGLSRLEIAHRKKAATIGLATAWVGFLQLLLVAGNALWKHVTLGSPTFHRPDCYVVSRDNAGLPIVTIHHEVVRLVTLARDVQQQVLEGLTPAERTELDKAPEWQREVDIYSVCRLKRPPDGGEEDAWSWEYWQETAKGIRIDGTDIETDYDDCPMWPGWLIPSYGDDWGVGYCEAYRGDLYSVEANHSALNDVATIAGYVLGFVKPGSRTSLKNVRKAKNLDMLNGSAEDVSFLQSQKTADAGWLSQHSERAERRLGTAFLLFSATRREGERVTADEVSQVAQELDQAMGGLYTQLAQGSQRRMMTRFVRLHEESSDTLPVLPKGLVDVQVVTGVDAMGRSIEAQSLLQLLDALFKYFPQKMDALAQAGNVAQRLSASFGVKPDGLFNTDQQADAKMQGQQQQIAGAGMMQKAAGPVAGAIAKGMMDRANAQLPAPDQQQPTPDQQETNG